MNWKFEKEEIADPYDVVLFWGNCIFATIHTFVSFSSLAYIYFADYVQFGRSDFLMLVMNAAYIAVVIYLYPYKDSKKVRQLKKAYNNLVDFYNKCVVPTLSEEEREKYGIILGDLNAELYEFQDEQRSELSEKTFNVLMNKFYSLRGEPVFDDHRVPDNSSEKSDDYKKELKKLEEEGY